MNCFRPWNMSREPSQCILADLFKNSFPVSSALFYCLLSFVLITKVIAIKSLLFFLFFPHLPLNLHYFVQLMYR